MGHYTHLTLTEREDIMMMRRDGWGVSDIARDRQERIDRIERAVAQLVRQVLPGVHRAAEVREAPRRVRPKPHLGRRPRVRAGRVQVSGGAVVLRAD